jgi:hypothetical protein
VNVDVYESGEDGHARGIDHVGPGWYLKCVAAADRDNPIIVDEDQGSRYGRALVAIEQ